MMLRADAPNPREAVEEFDEGMSPLTALYNAASSIPFTVLIFNISIQFI